MIRRLAALALCSGLAAAAGCGTVRAQVGYGIGLGVDVQIPGLIHTGLGVGAFSNVGPLYGRASRTRRENFATIVAWHYESEEEVGADEFFGRYPPRIRHSCFAAAPPLTTIEGDDIGRDVMPWAFEIGLMLLAADVRLGFSPAGFGRGR